MMRYASPAVLKTSNRLRKATQAAVSRVAAVGVSAPARATIALGGDGPEFIEADHHAVWRRSVKERDAAAWRSTFRIGAMNSLPLHSKCCPLMKQCSDSRC